MINHRRSTRILKSAAAAFAVVLACPHANAQTQNPSTALPPETQTTDPPAKVPDFDVASVKESKSGSNSSRWMIGDDGVTMSNINLKNMIAGAYNIKEDLISGGPAWVGTTGYDVNAKVAGEDVPTLKSLTPEQRDSMMQALLADRFHLKVHIEIKILPVYDLEPAKGGVKLKAVPEVKFDKADPTHTGSRFMFNTGHFQGQRIKMDNFAENLGNQLHRTVVNKTGLPGFYDIDLKYTPEEGEGGESKSDNGADAAPSIFTAIEEQLGLKLQPAKGPVKTLVIDHVEKPSEN